MRTLIAVLLAALLGGCSGDEKPDGSGRPSGQAGEATSAEDDVSYLGKEIFDLVDRAMSYRSSHRGRLPKSFRELGIDALTPATSRSLAIKGDVPEVTVSFRDPGARTLASCRGTSAILGEAVLSGGEFSVICALQAGGSTTLRTSRY